MRDLGEGIPRMFDEMDRAGCYPPRFEVVGGFMFQVSLRNEPIYGRDTLEWLKQFDEVQLSGDQKRMMAYAHAHGNRFTSRDYQRVTDSDIYGASKSIKDMIRKRVLRSTGKGSRVYECQAPITAHPDLPSDLVRLMPVITRNGRLTNADVVKVLGVSRPTATRLLNEWLEGQWIRKEGQRRWTAYYLGEQAMHQPQYASKNPEADA